MASSLLRRREIPLFITALSIIITLASYFFVVPILTDANTILQRANVVVAGTASLLGLINITLVMGRRIIRRQPGHWYFAAWGLFMLYATSIVGLGYGPFSKIYTRYFQAIQAPLYSATTGLLIFFITTACYRTFRAKTLETALLVLSGSFVLLGNAPIGEIISPVFPQLSTWILDIPNTAATRGMAIGSGLGVIGLGLRTMIGRERAAVPSGG